MNYRENGDVDIYSDEDGGKTLTVLELLGEMKAKAEQASLSMVQAIGMRNERFIHGFQDSKLTGSDDVMSLATVLGGPSESRNYTRKLALTYASRMLEERPNVKAMPNEASGWDIAVAEVANAVIEYVWNEQNIDDKLYDACVLAQAHGSVYMFVSWDPSAGKPGPAYLEQDELGNIVEVEGQPQGDVDVEAVSIFDLYTDGAPEIEDSLWCYRRRYVDAYIARAMLRASGAPEDCVPTEQAYISPTFGERYGVEVIELYHRPSPRIPQGLFACIVDNRVVDAMTYPYAHGELPAARWKINNVRGSQFGTTHISDGIPSQRAINRITETIEDLTDKTGDGVRLLAVKEISEAWEAGSNVMEVGAPELVQGGAKWLEPPSPPPLLFSQLEQKKTELHDVVGLSEMLVGRTDTGVSGKAVAYLNKLDGQAMAGAARSRDRMLKRMTTLILRTMQQFCVDERVARVVGDDGMMRVVPFKGSTLSGVDIRLEPRSGADAMRTTAAEAAAEAGAQGMLPPDQASERAQTGLPGTLMEQIERELVQEQIAQTMQGAVVQPDPTITPGVAQQEISRAISVETQNGRGQFDPVMQALRALLAMYAQTAPQQESGNVPPAQSPEGLGALPETL